MNTRIDSRYSGELNTDCDSTGRLLIRRVEKGAIPAAANDLGTIEIC